MKGVLNGSHSLVESIDWKFQNCLMKCMMTRLSKNCDCQNWKLPKGSLVQGPHERKYVRRSCAIDFSDAANFDLCV